MNEAGIENSAILLMSLGEEEAAEVLKFLGPKDVQKHRARDVEAEGGDRDRIEAVLGHFNEQAEQQTSIGGDTDDYVRNVLTKALGDDKAGFLLDRILQGGDTAGIESLQVDGRGQRSPSSSRTSIRRSSPRSSSTSSATRRRRSCRTSRDRLRNDVILRIATLDGIQPAALRELNDVLAKVLAGADNVKKAALGGVRAAAEILNFMGTAHETVVIDAVKRVRRASSRRRSSTRCSCSRTCSTSTIAASSRCCARSSPSR